jgi:hypothetical protein
MVEDTKLLAERQKHWRRHNTRWRRDKNIGEDVLPLAKRQNNRQRHADDCLETKTISEAFPTMVGDDSYLIE